MPTPKQKREEAQFARMKLQEIMEDKTMVYTQTCRTSQDGMSRSIKALVSDGDRGIINISHLVAKTLGWRYSKTHQAVQVQGCGMDMGFHLVYSLSSTLFAGSEMDVHSAGTKLNHRWL